MVRAHSSIRAEMGDPRTGTLGAPVVDQVKLDQLRDQMMFGDDTHSSAAERLLKLCTSPGTFRRVDPLRYLTTAIRRDATTAVRRAIGDPHIGPKVRGLARELGTTTSTPSWTSIGEGGRRTTWPPTAPSRRCPSGLMQWLIGCRWSRGEPGGGAVH